MSRPAPRRPTAMAIRAVAAMALAGLASCNIGPRYERPSDNLPAAWKNAGLPERPPEGDWFRLFRDPTLNALLRSAETHNPDLKAAWARHNQARAALGLARADQRPTLTGDLVAERKRDSGGAPFRARDSRYNDYDATLDLSYEVDLWGRIRRLVDQAGANVEATAADYDAALLSIKAEITRNYFTLRALEREQQLVSDAVDLRTKRRSLIRSQREEGQASGLDYQRAVAEEESARATLARLAEQQGRLVAALAALSGRPATSFSISSAPNSLLGQQAPAIPAGVPSDLLRRRPDLLAAERRLASAHAGIAVAITTYLPRITLNGSGGLSSLDASDLFDANSRFWSLGPTLFLPLVGGGQADNDRAQAEARYQEELANYGSVLLNAIRDTESALQSGRTLEAALASQRQAAEAARSAAELSRVRREGGLVSLFEVIESERIALEEERLLAATQRDRLLATVNLVQALGGGWKQ